jgi:hypothetical protein
MEDSPDHEILSFLKVQNKIARLSNPIKATTSGALVDALNQLSTVPFFTFPYTSYGDISITIAGEAAGTFKEPSIDVIMRHSTPSSFGKGDQTVLDPEYRYGREIAGDKIKIVGWYEYHLKDDISAMMFLGRSVNLKLHKLAIYEKGGHFDWHMDSTHSDSHHATFLVALNTSWTGGDLLFRRNGIESRVDLHPEMKSKMKSKVPKTEKSDSMHDVETGLTLQTVAFYTDTEHKVEPVADGVRLVFQYDVEVTGYKKVEDEDEDSTKDDEDEDSTKDGEDEDSTKDDEDEDSTKDDEDEDSTKDDEDEDSTKDDEDEDSTKDDEDGYLTEGDESRLIRLADAYSRREPLQEKFCGSSAKDKVKRVVKVIEKQFQSGVKEIAFTLQYLYRKSSILPEFLKGNDALLYERLAELFDVSLHAVVLVEESDYEGSYYGSDTTFCVHLYPKSKSGESQDDEEGDEKVGVKIFHVPYGSAIIGISQQDFIEYTGNEAQPAEHRYFGIGMFVSPRMKTSTAGRSSGSASG